MEHLSTFGLARDPFANEPDLDFYFEAPGQAQAERRVLRGLLQTKGLCVLTGPAGSGKTLLLRKLLEALEEERFEACVLVPVPGVSDGAWLLDRLAWQLGVEGADGAPAARLAQIYERLAAIREEGRHAVLVVDEAQILAEQHVLRALRGLLNLEYEDRRLLSVVLVGPPALERALAAEPALADRVELRVVLGPLDPASVGEYLAHRVRRAGGDPAIFEPGARDALAKLAAGLPRRLNNLADAALFEAHLVGRSQVLAEDATRAASDLGLLPAGARGPSPQMSDEDDTEPPEVFAADTNPPVFAVDDREADEALEAMTRAPRGEGASGPAGSLAEEGSSDAEIEELFADLVDDSRPA